MGFFQIYDVPYDSVDQELYERVYNRYIKIYPEANDSNFVPTYSEQDTDWDNIWDEEYVRLEKERYEQGTGEKNQSIEGEEEDEDIYGPQAPPPPKKKKNSKSKKDKEATDTVENCSSEQNPNAPNCNFSSFICTIDDGGGQKEIPFYSSEGTRTLYSVIGLACNNNGFFNNKSDLYRLRFDLVNSKGPCDEHGGKVFYIYGNNYSFVNETDTTLEIDVFSTHNDEIDEMYYDVQLDHVPEKIRVVIDQCGNHEEIEIHVVPRYVFDLDLSIAFKDKKTQDVGWDRPKGETAAKPKSKEEEIPVDQMVDTPHEQKLTFTKNINGNKNDWGVKVGEGKVKYFQKLSNVLEDYFKVVDAWFSKFAQLTVKMPKVTGKGSWYYKTKDDYTLARTGSYTISCSPLLGFTFELSLIKSGIIGGPALGKALELAARVKDWTDGHVDISFDITILIGGDINIELAQYYDKNTPIDATVLSSVQLLFNAKASIEADLYIIKAKAAASGSASVKFSMSVVMHAVFLPQGNWIGKFDGLEVGMVGSYELGVGWLSTTGEFNSKYTVVGPRDLWNVPFDLN